MLTATACLTLLKQLTMIEINHKMFKNVHLWQHTDPYLYQLKVTVLDEQGAVVEIVPYQFGFRRVEMKNKIMLLNGKRISFERC
jgi:Beta-galactosidase/beta-glucuronidase